LVVVITVAAGGHFELVDLTLRRTHRVEVHVGRGVHHYVVEFDVGISVLRFVADRVPLRYLSAGRMPDHGNELEIRKRAALDDRLGDSVYYLEGAYFRGIGRRVAALPAAARPIEIVR